MSGAAPYGWLLPVQASTFAADIDRGIWIIHAAMLLLFVLWGVFFVYLLFRFRDRGAGRAERRHMPLWQSLAPDAAVLLFEIALVVFYAVPGWSRIKRTFPSETEARVVEVVAEQFNWSFRYPGGDRKFGRTAPSFVDFANPFGIDPADEAGKDDVVSVNELRLPVDEKVLVRLSSKDVIHSFSIASFRVKQDAVPGLVIPVWFEPTRTGDYEITCAQLCGVGHAVMRADVRVRDREEFDAWLAKRAEKKEEKTAEAIEEW